MVMGMVVDVGVVKNHIKPKADSTLYNMRKADLIEYIRTLEHNYNVAVSFNKNQARYIESLGIMEVVRCKNCKHYDNSEGIQWCKINSKFYPGGFDWHSFPEDGFCSYGERRTDA